MWSTAATDPRVPVPSYVFSGARRSRRFNVSVNERVPLFETLGTNWTVKRPKGRAPLNTYVPSGTAYRVASPPGHARVTPELAEELRRVLERFAVEAGATGARPVTILFRPGIFGHHQVDRAADIYAVGGFGLDDWKRRWDAAQCQAAAAASVLGRRLIVETEQKRNLGWRLYKALQRHGRWAQPYGYPIQLFGPWTRGEGPWRYISDFLLNAHRDHIHVAK